MSVYTDPVTDAAIAAVGTGVRLYKVGGVPAVPVYPYGVVSCDSGVPSNYRLCATAASHRHNLAVQAFAKTADQLSWLQRRIGAALQGATFVLTDEDATPLSRIIAATVGRDPDDNAVLGGTEVYEFTTTPKGTP